MPETQVEAVAHCRISVWNKIRKYKKLSENFEFYNNRFAL